MLRTVMRTQELFYLDPRYISEDGLYIVIEQASAMENGTAVISKSKSQDIYRTVPNPKSVHYCAGLLQSVPTKYRWEYDKPDIPCDSFFSSVNNSKKNFV